jgi:hypothetical protein
MPATILRSPKRPIPDSGATSLAKAPRHRSRHHALFRCQSGKRVLVEPAVLDDDEDVAVVVLQQADVLGTLPRADGINLPVRTVILRLSLLAFLAVRFSWRQA